MRQLQMTIVLAVDKSDVQVGQTYDPLHQRNRQLK